MPACTNDAASGETESETESETETDTEEGSCLSTCSERDHMMLTRLAAMAANCDGDGASRRPGRVPMKPLLPSHPFRPLRPLRPLRPGSGGGPAPPITTAKCANGATVDAATGCCADSGACPASCRMRSRSFASFVSDVIDSDSTGGGYATKTPKNRVQCMCALCDEADATNGAAAPGPGKVTHNCYTKEVWSAEKQDWCCANKQLGCPPKTKTRRDEMPKDETPKDETPKDEAPKDETPENETPKDEAPKDDTPK